MIEVPEPWWHAAWFVQILVTLMLVMFGCIGWFYKQWRTDRRKLIELELNMRNMENGVTFAQFRERVNTLWHWWQHEVEGKRRQQ